MFDRAWEFVVQCVIAASLPMICFYHAVCGNIFLNVSVEEASGLERVGNTLLIPFQYLFAGKTAKKTEDGNWFLTQTFDYETNLAARSVVSLVSFPVSIVLGPTCKALSFIQKDARENYASLKKHLKKAPIKPNLDLYEKLQISSQDEIEFFPSQNHKRREGDENHMMEAKKGLKVISEKLSQHNIAWWVDCGTLLGTYRYGGIIPWDGDIDIALLLSDYENVKKALRNLDPKEYLLQDWSGRDFPDTFLKVYVKKTGELIDLYFYDIDLESKTSHYIFSWNKNIFLFEWVKIRERRFEKPVALDTLFPLKKAMFDGIEVFVPNDPVKFLQRYYGENLDPVRIFDPTTNRYEKDLTHPYWENAYVH